MIKSCVFFLFSTFELSVLILKTKFDRHNVIMHFEFVLVFCFSFTLSSFHDDDENKKEERRKIFSNKFICFFVFSLKVKLNTNEIYAHLKISRTEPMTFEKRPSIQCSPIIGTNAQPWDDFLTNIDDSRMTDGHESG